MRILRKESLPIQQNAVEVLYHASHTTDSMFTQVTQADSEQEVIESSALQCGIYTTAVDIGSMAYSTIG